MFLKYLELFGFKSFPERTRFDFADGITALLGPNGCGKSNVVDAIKWVLGEQNIKSLRASKREDVIFNGTALRKPMQMAEVLLVIDNEEGILQIDYPEVSILRRLFRNGESEYQINGQRCLLKNVKELFMDTGVGKSAYSILEQGKIDLILSNKPEERRYVFEEAAGISRFKVQTAESQRKLENTERNIFQVESVLAEVKRTYDSRKVQASRTRSYHEAKAEVLDCEISLQLSTIQTYGMLKDSLAKRLEDASSALADALEKQESFKSSSSQEQEDLREAQDRKSDITSRIAALDEQVKGYQRTLDYQNDRLYEYKTRKAQIAERVTRNKEILDNAQDQMNQRLERISDLKNRYLDGLALQKRLESELAESKSQKDRRRSEIGDLEKSVSLGESKLHEFTMSLTSLTGEIVSQLDEKLKGSGYSSRVRLDAERSFLSKLGQMRKAILEKEDFIKGVLGTDAQDNAVSMTFEQIRDDLDELNGLFQEYSGTVPNFIDDLLSPSGIIAQKRLLDKQYSEVADQIALDRSSIEKLGVEIERLETLISSKSEALSSQVIANNDLSYQCASAQRAIEEFKSQLEERRDNYDEALQAMDSEDANIEKALDDIRQTKAEMADSADRIASQRELLSEVGNHIDELNRRISGHDSLLSSLFDQITTLGNEKIKLETNIANLAEQISAAYSSFFDSTGKNLHEFESRQISENPEELRQRLDELKRKIAAFGFVNEMAEDEFQEAKTKYDFLSGNLADLNKAKEDLLTVIEQIRKQSEDLFMETYTKISEAFQEMFSKLLSGGKAALELEDPDNPLESGIIISAQPPGKKMNPLSLLSGGERSMTAVALLFATYMVKPSPFCILDEIDAALDRRNIGAFMSVLDVFGEKSQFIIITHNKATATAASTLLGVVQEEPGVSTSVSFRLGSEPNMQGVY